MLLWLSTLCFGSWEATWLELPLSPTMLHFCIQSINLKEVLNTTYMVTTLYFREIPFLWEQLSVSFSCFVFKSYLHSLPSHPDHFQLVWKLHRGKKLLICLYTDCPPTSMYLEDVYYASAVAITKRKTHKPWMGIINTTFLNSYYQVV